MPELGYRTDHRALDTRRILEALAAARVDFVLIGGVASIVHGVSRNTLDADVVPATDDANLERFLDALHLLGAGVFVDPRRMAMEDGDPWEIEVLRRGAQGLLEAEAWHFSTDAGPIDVVFDAAAVGGYDEHLPGVEVLEIFGLEVRVAGLDDLIRSKESLGREKDMSVLAELRRLREDRATGGPPGR